MELNEIKRAMMYKLPVIHRDMQFKHITKCILYLRGKEWRYSVEMLDRSGNSVTIADMHEVEIAKEDANAKH